MLVFFSQLLRRDHRPDQGHLLSQRYLRVNIRRSEAVVEAVLASFVMEADVEARERGPGDGYPTHHAVVGI